MQVWLENRDFGGVLSDLKKRVRHALQGSEISAPVPVAAVAPWTPTVQEPQRDSKKPN